MRILHLDGSSEDVGGVLSVLRNVAGALRAPGWSHSVWVNEAYSETRRPPLDYRRSRQIVSDSPSHLKIAVQAARASCELKRLLREEPFDILHAHSRGTLLAGMLATRSLGLPIVFTNHAYARRRAMYRWMAQRKNFFTVLLTPNMARYYGIPPQPPRISIVSACCADSYFAVPLAGARPPTSDPLRLSGIGSLLRWKNWRLVLEALLKLSAAEQARVEFSLWGPTPNNPAARRYEAELRALVLQHRLEKHFLFRGPTLSIPEVLRAADWFVLPSTNEPCSVALIEALALGLPALVSASGGNVDIVRPGRTGLMFSPEDATDLARQLRAVLSGHTTLLPPAEIRESVRPRSASCVAGQYEGIYRAMRSEMARSPQPNKHG